MIDTDKYEGHTKGPWKVTESWNIAVALDDYPLMVVDMLDNSKDLVLMADAPLLLEEVKRLNRFAHCVMNFMTKHDLDFQFLNEHGVYTAPDGGSISTFIPYSYTWDDETKVSSKPIQFTVRGEEE